MANSNPISGLAEYYLFPYYATQDDYKKATGKEAPAFKPFKPRKHWFDPAAKDSAKRYITYDRAVVTKVDGITPDVGPDRKPIVDQLIVLKEDAAELNIPPTVFYEAGEMPVVYPEVQPPLKPLEAGEVFDFVFGGSVVVKRPEVLETLNGGFTSVDRRLLQSIAAKLGVE